MIVYNEVRDFIDTLKKHRDTSSTYYSTILKQGRKTWAVVLAWVDGFENKGDDGEYLLDTYRICGKVAYNNSYMKEYDMDWLMPDDGEEVYNTETSIEADDDIGKAIHFFEHCWTEIEKNYLEE
jgi:hypothetical protein